MLNKNNKKKNLKDAIIGYTGYVGSFIKSKKKNVKIYNSKNINKITHKKFNNVYLAAPDSLKFLANKHPVEDKKKIKKLINFLKTIKCKKLIFFSTVDTLDLHKNNFYGKNRRLLEKFILNNFQNYLILRFPSLFGWKLKKNFFFDILNFKSLKFYNSKSKLQWYFIENIFKDIKYLEKKKITVANLVSEPITCKNIIKFLNHEISDFNNSLPIQNYNVKFFQKNYLTSKKKILKKMREIYIKSNSEV